MLLLHRMQRSRATCIDAANAMHVGHNNQLSDADKLNGGDARGHTRCDVAFSAVLDAADMLLPPLDLHRQTKVCNLADPAPLIVSF